MTRALAITDAVGQGPVIRLVNVAKSFGEQAVLKGVNLQIPRGKVTTIIGPSGGGKSVLLKHMIGLIQPDRGQVLVDDVDEVYRKLIARGVDISGKSGVHRIPIDQTWGMREFYVDDPDGNTVRFASEIR